MDGKSQDILILKAPLPYTLSLSSWGALNTLDNMGLECLMCAASPLRALRLHVGDA